MEGWIYLLFVFLPIVFFYKIIIKFVSSISLFVLKFMLSVMMIFFSLIVALILFYNASVYGSMFFSYFSDKEFVEEMMTTIKTDLVFPVLARTKRDIERNKIWIQQEKDDIRYKKNNPREYYTKNKIVSECTKTVCRDVYENIEYRYFTWDDLRKVYSKEQLNEMYDRYGAEYDKEQKRLKNVKKCMEDAYKNKERLLPYYHNSKIMFDKSFSIDELIHLECEQKYPTDSMKEEIQNKKEEEERRKRRAEETDRLAKEQKENSKNKLEELPQQNWSWRDYNKQ